MGNTFSTVEPTETKRVSERGPYYSKDLKSQKVPLSRPQPSAKNSLELKTGTSERDSIDTINFDILDSWDDERQGSFGGDEINFPENSFLSLKVPINNEMANFSNSSLASAKMTMEERGFDPPLCQDLLVENEYVTFVQLKKIKESEKEEITFQTNLGKDYVYILDEFDENVKECFLTADPEMCINGVRMGPMGLEFEQIYIDDYLNNGFSPETMAAIEAETAAISSDEEYDGYKKYRSTFWLPGSINKGYFEKRGMVNKSFQRRFFVLAESSDLYYFADDSCKVQKGEISIGSGAETLSMGKNQIQLVCYDRTWTFRFSDIFERNDWMEHIQLAIAAPKRSRGFLALSGYMKKLGGNRKNWKFRYFKLYDNLILKYYTDENSSQLLGQTELSGGTKITHCAGEEGWNYQFEVHTEERIWYFRVRKLQERVHWTNAIRDRWRDKNLSET